MPGFMHNMMLRVIRRSSGDKVAIDAMTKGTVIRETPNNRLKSKYQLQDSHFEKYRIYHYSTVKNGDPILYLLHGGGFVLGMTRAHFEPFGRLSYKTGFGAIAPDFPLPPETDNKGVVNYILSHFRQVLSEFPDSPIIVLGDSAGAHLSLNLTQRLNLEERARIRALYLLFGVYDLTRPVSELEFPKEEVLLTRDLAQALPNHWAGSLSYDDPLVSPILGDLNELPFISIYSANKDPIYPESVRLSEKLSSMNIEHRHETFEGYGHDFVLFPSPDGKKALANIAKSIRRSML